MKPSRLLLAVATLALALVFIFTSPTATAAAKKAGPPPVDPRKLIQSVDTANSSIVIQFMRDKTLHTYKIDDLTVLKVNNVPGKITGIKAGMVVDDFVERDDQTLDGISVSGYGTDPAAPKPKTTPKPKPPQT